MILAGTNAAGQSPALNMDFGKVLKCYVFPYRNYLVTETTFPVAADTHASPLAVTLRL